MFDRQRQIQAHEEIAFNRRVHDAIVDDYERRHGDIFNPVEQARLRRMLQQAIATTRLHASSCRALDYGCGSGNLTRHLIELGVHVVAADVSPKFLDIVRTRYGATAQLDTLPINGVDLDGIPDDSFDLVAAYSVLHHIPDYLHVVKELCRVCKAGGVAYIDHEHTNTFFDRPCTYVDFCNAVSPGAASRLAESIRLLLDPGFYVRFIRKRINPRYSAEGDIHVWPDDHIQWDSLEEVMRLQGFTTVVHQEYLLFKRSYPSAVYERYADKCADMAVLIAVKNRTQGEL